MRINLSTGVRATIGGHCGQWSIMLSSPDGCADFSVLLTDEDRDKVCAALGCRSKKQISDNGLPGDLRESESQ